MKKKEEDNFPWRLFSWALENHQWRNEKSWEHGLLKEQWTSLIYDFATLPNSSIHQISSSLFLLHHKLQTSPWETQPPHLLFPSKIVSFLQFVRRWPPQSPSRRTKQSHFPFSSCASATSAEAPLPKESSPT